MRKRLIKDNYFAYSLHIRFFYPIFATAINLMAVKLMTIKQFEYGVL